jgi:uncharacterized DUF497 family protein
VGGLKFEWDPAKAAKNVRNHGISFDEARTVFDDPHVWVEYDGEHSRIEDRWRAIGFSNRLRLLSVVYTKRNETAIRLISARRATKAEGGRYAVES